VEGGRGADGGRGGGGEEEGGADNGDALGVLVDLGLEEGLEGRREGGEGGGGVVVGVEEVGVCGSDDREGIVG